MLTPKQYQLHIVVMCDQIGICCNCIRTSYITISHLSLWDTFLGIGGSSSWLLLGSIILQLVPMGPSYQINSKLYHHFLPFILGRLPSRVRHHLQPVDLRHLWFFWFLFLPSLPNQYVERVFGKPKLLFFAPSCSCSWVQPLLLSGTPHSTEAGGQMFAIPLTLVPASAAPRHPARGSALLLVLAHYAPPSSPSNCSHLQDRGHSTQNRAWQICKRVEIVKPTLPHFYIQAPWILGMSQRKLHCSQ